MRSLFPLFAAALACVPAAAQTVCAPTPVYSPCEISFELNDQEAGANPNPYLTVQIEVEFRSPRFRTVRMPAFWDGGRKMTVRFTPTDDGEWTFRVTGNIQRFEGKEGTLTATASEAKGFLRPANVHHWAWVDESRNGQKTPHLWMGDTIYTFPFIDRSVFDKLIDTRAAQKFNHVRGVILSRDGRMYPKPDTPDAAAFRELDDRILYMNRKGIVADLVLGWDRNHLAQVFPSRELRERYIRYVVARYAAFNITWQGVQEFEEYENGRALLKEIYELIRRLDPYQHPRSTHAAVTSSPLFGDGWEDYILYQSADDNLGAIEHQLFASPFVNAGFAYEDSGAGRARPGDVDTAEFRRRLWNASMNGQYPYFGNTGTYGGGNAGIDLKYADSPGARQMSVWFDFFSRTRFWELEPFFDVDGGRAIALERPREDGVEGIEYVVYVEKPGPVEIVLPKHSYDVAWINPIDGEVTKVKQFKADRWSGEPPSKDHDWVLHISRERRKEGLRSYKFESRAIILQEVEQNPTRAPFQIAAPAEDSISVSKPAAYEAKLTRETRATRSMLYLWTAEVPGEEQSFRVVGTGAKGTFHVPDRPGRAYPASLAVRVYGMNANGKVYSVFRVWKLVP